MVLVYLLILLFVFYILARVCEDYFIPSLDLISHKLKLPDDVAGATLMAAGSSAPELFTALIALTKVGSQQVGAGTIVGSAIFNILIIVGVSAIVAKAHLRWQPVLRDLGFYILAIVLLLLTFSDGKITLTESLLYLSFYVFYIVILTNWKKWHKPGPQSNSTIELIATSPRIKHPVLSFFIGNVDGLLEKSYILAGQKKEKYIAVFIVSLAWIIGLSWVLVETAVGLAHSLNIPEVIVALTVLAAGTSVPDLLSSLIVARKGRGGMAISNAIGSNTFDILVGLGLPWLLYILWQGKSVTVGTENLIASIFLLFFTVIALLFLLILRRFKIGRKSGYLLVGLYIIYIVYSLFKAF